MQQNNNNISEGGIEIEPRRTRTQYQFSAEEVRVIKECNRESFYQRCLPLGSLLGFATYYSVKSGYGNISPHTLEGKLTTVIYAIVGMPLFLLYLSNIGDVMAHSFKWIYANCCLCRWCPGVAKRRAERRKLRAELEEDYDEEQEMEPYDSYDQERTSSVSTTETEESYDVQTVTVPVTICLLIMVGYICCGAILFCKWENWEFLDAFYFCFISLSTIGFGDLVPGDKIYRRGDAVDLVGEVLELSFIFCSMYLMLGMALIAMCFNLMQEEVIHKIRTTVRSVKYILRCDR